MSSTMTIRIDDNAKERLDKLAVATGRSRSYLAGETIQQFIELNEWQVGEIHQALDEASRGEFASDAHVKQLFDGWRRRAR